MDKRFLNKDGKVIIDYTTQQYFNKTVDELIITNDYGYTKE